MLLIASLVIMVNLVVDLLYGLINPRIRRESRPMAEQRTVRDSSRAAAVSPLGEVWFSMRANPGAMAGLVVHPRCRLLAAIFADVIAPHDPIEQFRDHLLQPPIWQDGRQLRSSGFGTDAVGRDILSRLIYGARLSLLIGCIVVTISLAAGHRLGLLAGFFRGWFDIVIMRVMDILLALPSLLLAIVIVAILGPGLLNAMIAIAIAYCRTIARLTRAAVLTELSKDYVIASRVSGAGTLRLMFMTVLPNCVAPLIVQATLRFASAILDAAALGFLGLGAQPPTPEWGTMLADALQIPRSARPGS